MCEHSFRKLKGFAFKWLVIILCKYTVTFPFSSSQDILQRDCITSGTRCRSCASAVRLELSDINTRLILSSNTGLNGLASLRNNWECSPLIGAVLLRFSLSNVKTHNCSSSKPQASLQVAWVLV